MKGGAWHFQHFPLCFSNYSFLTEGFPVRHFSLLKKFPKNLPLALTEVYTHEAGG